METPRLNLMLHCGASAVETQELDRVELPPIKRNSQGHITFQPVSHEPVRVRIKEALTSSLDDQLAVVAEAQGMTHDGQRAFGMMQVHHPSINDTQRKPGTFTQEVQRSGLVIGWRNSHDQSFASAVAMGAGVFVCDNLSFCGEVKVSRRHTRHIVRDLPEVIARAVGRLLAVNHRQQEFFNQLERFPIHRPLVNDTLVEAMRTKAIPNASIPKVLAEYESEKHKEMHGTKSAWSLFNAFTEVSKNDTPTLAMKRTQRLHGVFGKLLSRASDLHPSIAG